MKKRVEIRLNIYFFKDTRIRTLCCFFKVNTETYTLINSKLVFAPSSAYKATGMGIAYIFQLRDIVFIHCVGEWDYIFVWDFSFPSGKSISIFSFISLVHNLWHKSFLNDWRVSLWNSKIKRPNTIILLAS